MKWTLPMSAKLSALGRVGKHNGLDLLLLRDMSKWDVFYRHSLWNYMRPVASYSTWWGQKKKKKKKNSIYNGLATNGDDVKALHHTRNQEMATDQQQCEERREEDSRYNENKARSSASWWVGLLIVCNALLHMGNDISWVYHAPIVCGCFSLFAIISKSRRDW